MKIFEFKWLTEIENRECPYCIIKFGPYEMYELRYNGKTLKTRKLTTVECNTVE